MNWWKPLDPELPGSPILLSAVLGYYRVLKGVYCFKAQTISEALAISDFVTKSKIAKLTHHTDNLKLDLTGKYIQVFVESLGCQQREIIGESVYTYVALVDMALHQACYIEFNPTEFTLNVPISVAGKLNSELTVITPEYYEGLTQAERLLFVSELYEQLRLTRAAIASRYHIDLDVVVSGDELEHCVVKGSFYEGGDSKHSVNVSISSPEHRFVGTIS